MRAGEEETDRLMVVEDQQDEREAKHANDLGDDTDVVDDRDQPLHGNIDGCADDDRNQGDKDPVWHAQNRCRYVEDRIKWDSDGERYSSHRENASKEVDPAGEPAQAGAG